MVTRNRWCLPVVVCTIIDILRKSELSTDIRYQSIDDYRPPIVMCVQDVIGLVVGAVREAVLTSLEVVLIVLLLGLDLSWRRRGTAS